MRTLRKYLLLLALCCLSLVSAEGQLIQNPQFHELNPASPLNNCPTANVIAGSAINRLQDMCRYWFTPTNGTPDYFYGCDNVGGPDYGVPVHSLFNGNCEDPIYASGSYAGNFRAYAGIAIVDNPSLAARSREYISQTLTSPLSPGKAYQVSFLVRSSNLNTKYLVQRLGCLLTAGAPNSSNTADGDDGALNTSIGDYGEAVQVGGWDANSWQYVSINVFVGGTAKGYLTIGNFQADIPDNEWIPQPGMGPVGTGMGEGYYMIDNVHICEVCAVTIGATRVTSTDPDKCCYDITFTANSNDFCGALYGFRLKNASTGAIMYNSSEYISGSSHDVFRVCVDRFTSGNVIFEMLDINGNVICSQLKELPCDCSCNFYNPSGFSIAIERNASAPMCCWDVIVRNNSTCDMHLRGITVNALPPAIVTPTGGYTKQPMPFSPFTYLTKNNTNGGDTYAAGTSTVVGTICLPQNTLDVNVFAQAMKAFDPSGSIENCGTGTGLTISCADACCMEVLNTVKVAMGSPNPLECCFMLNVQLDPNRTCITNVVLQAKNGGSWVDEITMPSVPNTFGIPQCITVGTTKQVRLLFKNSSGEVVCVREFTLACEEECCSAVTYFHSYRISTTPCCYRIVGDIQPTKNCRIVDYLVQEYDANSQTWNTIVSPVTFGPDGHFETVACISGSPRTIRVQFRGSSGNVLCTRWLNLSCGGVTGKMGVGNNDAATQLKASAVPNPAIGETTIHYVVPEEADVRVSLYNTLGELLAEVQPGIMSVGMQQTVLSIKELPAGMYLVQVQVGTYSTTVPLTVVK